MNITIIMSSSSSSSLPLPSAAAAGKAPPATQKKAVALSASFPPTVWGDGFLDKLDLSLQAKQKHPEYEVLKEDVRKMVVMNEAKSSTGGVDDEAILIAADKLWLIDAVQRLGVGYHFETEIEKTLEKVHDLGEGLFINGDHDKNNDLYHEALRFRLLRQQGFPVSPHGFRQLKNNEGKFKEWLWNDEKGLLSLYEAAHMAFNGEDILDEALNFATKTLKSSILPHKMNPNSFQKQIDFALRVPAWKRVPRSLARHSIDFCYSDDHRQGATNQNDQKLLRFAKMDFNMVQKFHQQELYELSDWRRSIDMATNFPYARDRLVESYAIFNSAYFEPKYRLGRIFAAKFFFVLTIMDDFFDNFATYEEVRTLTEAIQRLDGRALQELPDDRMQNVYRLIYDLYDEMEREVGKTGPTFGVDYAKGQLKKLIQYWSDEIRWRAEGRVPTMEEFMNNVYVAGSMPLLCTSAFLGMGAETATREAFEWSTNESKMMRAASIIGRLQNDITSHKFEQERDQNSASAIQCYMKQHGASEDEAVEFLWEEISKAWKDIAEEYCGQPTSLPVARALVDRLLNLVRCANLLYLDDDCFTNSHLLKDHLTSLFIDPVPL